jgi:hypothetical protein
MTWSFNQRFNDNGYGIFCVHAWLLSGRREDITFFRDVPVTIQSMEFVDPFGDAVCVLEFGQCTGYDLGTPESDTWFLNENVNIDIWWVPATTVPGLDEHRVLDPNTNAYGTMWLHPEDATIVYEGYTQTIDPQPTSVTVNCQGALWQVNRFFAKPMFPLRPKTVESVMKRYFDPKRRGLASAPMEIDWDGSYSGVPQYALDFNYYPRKYMLSDYETYLAKDRVFLRYVPTDLEPGEVTMDPITGLLRPSATDTPWTGYLTRYTGGWDKVLESYIASQLSYMYYDVPDTNDPELTGLTPGDSWTIGKKPGRVPILYLKRQAKEPDLVAYYGQPGLELRVTRDGTQSTDVIFGKGKGYDGSQWMMQNFPEKAPWSTWRPIGYDNDPQGQPLYHWDDWPRQQREDLYDGYDWYQLTTQDIWIQEKNWASIPNGIEQDEGETIAKQYIARDRDPGWIGTATLSVDLLDNSGHGISKWTIKPGMVLHIAGFRGRNDIARGINVFHIARVEMLPQDGMVNLTLDTKFREIVSIEEAQQSTRDSLAPMKMLQAGRESALIEDLVMAWNINQGAGCFPAHSIKMPKEDTFPYEETTRKYPPKSIFKNQYRDGHNLQAVKDIVNGIGAYGQPGTLANAAKSTKQEELFYIPINVGNPSPTMRWGFCSLLLSQAFTIARTEFACYDEDGNVAPVEFHVSLFRTYHWNVDRMPNKEVLNPNTADATAAPMQYAALWDGAFEKIDPTTGLIWEGGPNLAYQYHLPSDNAMWFMGWGTFERPAGYSPGAKDRGDQPTGMLMDGAQWGFDFNSSADFLVDVNRKEEIGTPYASSYSGGCAVYAQIPEGSTFNHDWVYVMGRMYRQPQVGQ